MVLAVLGGGVGGKVRQRGRSDREPGALRQWLLGPRPRGGRRLWWLAGAVVGVAGLLTWALWPSSAPEPLARQYGEATACLLTDEHGVTGAEAAAVWAGMREASEATLTKVQFLEVDGPQTVDNAKTYLASLVQSRCDLVLAVGAGPVSAVDAEAKRFPNARFALVGGGTAAPNVSLVDATTPQSVRENVRAVVAAVKPAAQ
ncbi:hypothetical protein OG792_31410 [Micromonospora sp. NBC_01699]|uniref:hypothetical protein n=1 Tax=Micromonospora sp. NBC_01699 TaxID=2975984 RepID=UPI002E2D100A|nr:hypothetical protein [Micromonospora sp. NBC_01699]